MRRGRLPWHVLLFSGLLNIFSKAGDLLGYVQSFGVVSASIAALGTVVLIAYLVTWRRALTKELGPNVKVKGFSREVHLSVGIVFLALWTPSIYAYYVYKVASSQEPTPSFIYREIPH